MLVCQKSVERGAVPTILASIRSRLRQLTTPCDLSLAISGRLDKNLGSVLSPVVALSQTDWARFAKFSQSDEFRCSPSESIFNARLRVSAA